MAGRDGSPDPGGREERPGRRGFLFCVGFETGALLEAAKAELEHGEWSAMFQTGELPFDKRTAERLIVISCSDNIRNATHVSHLPIHWGTLYELAKLTDEQFDNGIQSGTINPQMLHRAPGKSPIDGCLNTGATKYWPTHKTPARDSVAGL
jgi:hypothetical protein